MGCRYPETLPSPTVDGNSMTVAPTFSRVEFDSGFRHRRSVNTPMMLEFSFILTKKQMQEFLDFYYVTLGRGVKEFYAVWEVNGFIEPKYFRFSKVFTASAVTLGLYKVGAEFQMMTTLDEMLDASEVEVFDDALNNILTDFGEIITVLLGET